MDFMDKYALTDEYTVAKIADVSPRAMPAYFLCLHKSDQNGLCSFTREEIINQRVRSWTKFKNDVRSLAALYVLNFSIKGDSISIEIIPQETP